jgi:hypothetical protein
VRDRAELGRHYCPQRRPTCRHCGKEFASVTIRDRHQEAHGAAIQAAAIAGLERNGSPEALFVAEIARWVDGIPPPGQAAESEMARRSAAHLTHNQGGTVMSDVHTLEQLKAQVATLAEAAAVEIDDAKADAARAGEALSAAQRLYEAVAAHWPADTAAPFRAMVEDAQLATAATEGKVAAADRRAANVRTAEDELGKQIAAEEAARAAGWQGGVTQAAPTLTGGGQAGSGVTGWKKIS